MRYDDVIITTLVFQGGHLALRCISVICYKRLQVELQLALRNRGGASFEACFITLHGKRPFSPKEEADFVGALEHQDARGSETQGVFSSISALKENPTFSFHEASLAC